MNGYDRVVLPGVIHRVMGDRRFRPYRERTAGSAGGRVPAVGFGSGLNLPHDRPTVNHVVGIGRSERPFTDLYEGIAIAPGTAGESGDGP